MRKRPTMKEINELKAEVNIQKNNAKIIADSFVKFMQETDDWFKNFQKRKDINFQEINATDETSKVIISNLVGAVLAAKAMNSFVYIDVDEESMEKESIKFMICGKGEPIPEMFKLK